MNIIILAGGKGTRFEDLSVFPKVLLPTPNHDSILSAHSKLFVDHDIYLIINQDYFLMVQDYCNVNNLGHIHIIPTTDSNGSYNTIRSVQHLIPRINRLFVWSDLEITDIDINDLTTNTVFTKEGEYRFHIGDVMERSDGNGNVPGVYYLHDEFWFQYVKDDYDLADWLMDVKIPCQTRPVDLIEYRDKSIYIKSMGSSSGCVEKTRFFNSLTIDKKAGVVKKSAKHSDYIPLMSREICWYNKLKEYQIDDIAPKLLRCGCTSMEIEYLDGYIPFYQAIKEFSKPRLDIVYSNLKCVLNRMHKQIKPVSELQFMADLKKEVIDKTIDRCNKIRHMLINYNETELVDLLHKAYNIIFKMTTKSLNHMGVEYVFGHADINGSNCMVDPITLDVKLIDPRAYFGSSILYIFEPYERAKILYCLSGYDDFNINPQVWGIDEPKAIIEMPYMDIDVKLLLAVIWISLAGYISQDIMKANISYEYGMKMLKNTLN